MEHDNGIFVDFVARLIWINIWRDEGFWIGQRLERSPLMHRGASSAKSQSGSSADGVSNPVAVTSEAETSKAADAWARRALGSAERLPHVVLTVSESVRTAVCAACRRRVAQPNGSNQ